jgi:hypothetical protein
MIETGVQGCGCPAADRLIHNLERRLFGNGGHMKAEIETRAMS